MWLVIIVGLPLLLTIRQPSDEPTFDEGMAALGKAVETARRMG